MQHLSWCFASLIWLMLASHAPAEAWRPLLPEGWFGVAAASDVEATEAKLARVLNDLSFDYGGAVSRVLDAVGADGLGLSDAELVVGVARAEAGDVYYFVLVPTTSFNELVSGLGGEVTGDVGVATLLGVDFCLAPCDGWTLVAPLDQLEAARSVMQRPAARDAQHEAPTGRNLLLELSPAGVGYLEDRASSVDPRSRRDALGAGLDWPPTLASLDAAIGQNRILLAKWRSLHTGLRVGITAGSDGGVTLRVEAPHTGGALTPEQATALPLPRFEVPGPVSRLSGAGRGGVAASLAELSLAYSQGRPDQIDAPSYPTAAYSRYAAAASAALSMVERFEAVTREPRADTDPLHSNRAALLRLADREAFFDAFKEQMERWNELVTESNAQIKLAFNTRPVEIAGQRGLEFDVDMVDAIDAGDTADIRRLMEKLFGEGGRYAWRLVPIGDKDALLTDLPKRDAQALVESLRSASAPPPTAAAGAWQAELHVERFLAWQAEVLAVHQGEVFGRRPPKPMNAAPPIRASITSDGKTLRAELSATRATLRAVGDYLRANRR